MKDPREEAMAELGRELALYERGRYATITGIALRHGERVKLLDYSSIDGKWYVEFFNGTIGRYTPDLLTPEPAEKP